MSNKGVPLMSPAVREKLAAFDTLPQDAIVPDSVASEILGISIWTLRRDDSVPRRQISERRYGRRVGDLRAKARGEAVGA